MVLRISKYLGFCLLAGVFGVAEASPNPLPQQGKDQHGVRFEGGFPITDARQIYPLSKIRRGQKGVGYTVFKGATLEPFGFEVLGLMQGMLGPNEHIILARLTGKNIEYTGVIAGMSGSPVYIDGKLVGAVSYRFGAFSKEPIAGITPIERMLALYGKEIPPKDSLAKLGTISKLSFEDYREASKLPAVTLGFKQSAQQVGPSGAQPISTPVAVSGMAPEVQHQLQQTIQAHGFHTQAGASSPMGGLVPNGSGEAGRTPAAPIAPGAPIAAMLMRGDMGAVAVGTVSFVDKKRVLGFGHPFVGYGHVSFPMATAAIINTLATPTGSYKMGAGALEVGIIDQDRLTAIAGELGKKSPMIPVKVTLHDYQGRKIHSQVEIADSPVWLPVLTESFVASSGLRRLGYQAGGYLEVTARYQVDDRTMEFSDAFAAPAPMRIAGYAARDVATTAAIIMRHEQVKARIKQIDVELKVRPEVLIYDIQSVTLAKEKASPGETIQAEVVLKPYRGQEITRKLSLTIPEGATGSWEFFVGGGLEVDRKDYGTIGPRTPKNLDQLLSILAQRRPSQRLYARLYGPEEGLRQGVEVYGALPLSTLASLDLEERAQLSLVTKELGPQVSSAITGIVTGSKSITVEVVP